MRLDAKEREKNFYRLPRQKDKAGKDVQHVKLIKGSDEDVLMSESVF